MKKSRNPSRPARQREYDFAGGERGKYAGRLRGGTRVVRLEPEIARHFPDSGAVNRALRLIVEVARKSVGR
jgi:hypothetical protein